LKGSLNDDKLKNVPRPQNIRMLTLCTKSSSAAVDTSLAISQIIENNLIQFTDGEYVKECMMKAM